MGAIKDKLTIQKAVETKSTLVDCVHYYFPDATFEECSFILWEKTCYPMDVEEVLDQLYEFYLSKDVKNGIAKNNRTE